MKKIFYAILVTLIVLLAACANTQTAKTNADKTLQETTTAKSGATVSKGCDWTPEAKARLEAEYVVGKTMLRIPSFAKGNMGDCVTMGVLAANLEPDQQNVFTQISFNRAYDYNGNPIETADASMVDWVADNNDPREFVVDSGKYATFPYFITVRTIKPGVDAVPGTYEFYIETWTKIGGVSKQIGKQVASVKV